MDVRVECGPSHNIRHRIELKRQDGLEHVEEEITLRTISNCQTGTSCYGSVANCSRFGLAEKFECDHVLERRFHYDTICKNECVELKDH